MTQRGTRLAIRIEGSHGGDVSEPYALGMFIFLWPEFSTLPTCQRLGKHFLDHGRASGKPRRSLLRQSLLFYHDYWIQCCRSTEPRREMHSAAIFLPRLRDLNITHVKSRMLLG